MDSIASRLKSARLRAGYASGSDAARAFDWPVSTYLGHENGDRNPSRKAAEKYARAFKTNAAWLLIGTGETPKRNLVQVYGFVGLGEAIEMVEATQSPLEEIELPYGFSVPNCGALIARGNSQFPRVKDGEVIVYHRNGLSPFDLLGQEAVVQVRNGPVLLKTIRRGSQPNLFHLESHNAPMREDQDIEWCGELLSIVPAGKWKKLR